MILCIPVYGLFWSAIKYLISCKHRQHFCSCILCMISSCKPCYRAADQNVSRIGESAVHSCGEWTLALTLDGNTESYAQIHQITTATWRVQTSRLMCFTLNIEDDELRKAEILFVTLTTFISCQMCVIYTANFISLLWLAVHQKLLEGNTVPCL